MLRTFFREQSAINHAPLKPMDLSDCLTLIENKKREDERSYQLKRRRWMTTTFITGLLCILLQAGTQLSSNADGKTSEAGEITGFDYLDEDDADLMTLQIAGTTSIITFAQFIYSGNIADSGSKSVARILSKNELASVAACCIAHDILLTKETTIRELIGSLSVGVRYSRNLV